MTSDVEGAMNRTGQSTPQHWTPHERTSHLKTRRPHLDTRISVSHRHRCRLMEPSDVETENDATALRPSKGTNACPPQTEPFLGNFRSAPLSDKNDLQIRLWRCRARLDATRDASGTTPRSPGQLPATREARNDDSSGLRDRQAVSRGQVRTRLRCPGTQVQIHCRSQSGSTKEGPSF